MYKLSKENFKSIEKFVVIKGENYNQDRCIVIPINFEHRNSEVTCCMDEIESEIRICQINGQDAENLASAICFTELTGLIENAIYSSSEEDKYKDYVEVIKMETECCDRECNRCKRF